jgi:hypothetical protein
MQRSSQRPRALPLSKRACARTPCELRAPPAVPPALARRQGGAGKFRGSAVRTRGRERGSGGARRPAAPHGRRAGPLRSPLACARSSQSSRRPLGGRGPARANPLQAEGWRLRRSLPWQGRGDIDSVAIAPTGVAVATETKTRSYDVRHLARVHEQAVWLSRRRRRWCSHGVLAVLCLVRLRGVQRVEDDVLIVSIDRLMPAVRSAAGAVLPPLQSGR